MAFWVDVRMRTNRAPLFYDPVATRDFDCILDAEAWAQEQATGRCYAIVSDDAMTLYTVNERHPDEPHGSPMGYTSGGKPAYITD